MGRQPCCDKVGLKRGPWTVEEDHKLMSFILNNGIRCWRTVPKLAGLLRCGKSCRLRWINYLRPDLKRGGFTETEEDQIIELHKRLGNRWSKIASHFPGRTDNEIKNHWNTRIKKKMKELGLDPLTHKPLKISEEKKKEEGSLEDKAIKVQQVNLDEAHGPLNNRDLMMWEDFDLGKWLDKETNTSYSCDSLFSLEVSNSTNFSSRDQLFSTQHESLQQWVDSVDSFLLSDNFNQLEDDILRNYDYHKLWIL